MTGEATNILHAVNRPRVRTRISTPARRFSKMASGHSPAPVHTQIIGLWLDRKSNVVKILSMILGADQPMIIAVRLEAVLSDAAHHSRIAT